MGDDGVTPLRLALVDDHALFREGLAALLASQPDFEVAGQFDSAGPCLELLTRQPVDAVLLDVDLGRERALAFIEAARRTGFAGRILIVTAGISDVEAVQLVRAGAHGIFHKQHPSEQLCQAIRQVAAGEAVLEQRYLRSLFSAVAPEPEGGPPPLSPREVNVLRQILAGASNKEIGAELDLSESSVKAVLRALFDKTGVRTRSQLVKFALDHYRDRL